MTSPVTFRPLSPSLSGIDGHWDVIIGETSAGVIDEQDAGYDCAFHPNAGFREIINGEAVIDMFHQYRADALDEAERRPDDA